MKEFWTGLRPAARLGLTVCALVVVAITVGGGWWLTRVHYDVLFSGLNPRDASAMSAELDRIKVPYVVGSDGTSLLVDRAVVHATRLKLMGGDLPLQGGVGFELFAGNDFGMTEFAQRINYQRALQGEISRTIRSLDEVENVRVILALPEQTLFKQVSSRPKASVHVSLKRGRRLAADQVAGIQRLVAAAVPTMSVEDVTLVDARGVALTRPTAADTNSPAPGAQLDLKREVEAYLAAKVGEVLDRTLGPGQAVASVDVSLDLDQVRVTTEQVVSPPARKGSPAIGTLVRERESTQDAGGPLDKAGAAGTVGSTQREADYAVGRRVEQVVKSPGSIRRIQVLAAVRNLPGQMPAEGLRKLVSTAIGAAPERGDVVTVLLLPAVGSPAAAAHGLPGIEPDLAPAAQLDTAPRVAVQPDTGSDLGLLIGAALTILSVLTLGCWGLGRRRGTAPLTPSQREEALLRIEQWLSEGEAAAPLGARAREGH